jgi:hypothetical protein
MDDWIIKPCIYDISMSHYDLLRVIDAPPHVKLDILGIRVIKFTPAGNMVYVRGSVHDADELPLGYIINVLYKRNGGITHIIPLSRDSDEDLDGNPLGPDRLKVRRIIGDRHYNKAIRKIISRKAAEMINENSIMPT